MPMTCPSATTACASPSPELNTIFGGNRYPMSDSHRSAIASASSMPRSLSSILGMFICLRISLNSFLCSCEGPLNAQAAGCGH